MEGDDKPKQNYEQSHKGAVDESKIETAVKFLQNPNVRKTAFDNKVAFLKKKGLSEREIDVAIERSGTQRSKDLGQREGSPGSISQDEAIRNTPSKAILTQPRPTSFGSQVMSVVVGGGIIAAAVVTIKNYIIPYFTGKETSNVKELKKSINKLETGLTEMSSLMNNTFQTLNQLLEEQKDSLAKLNVLLERTQTKLDLLPSDTTSLSDVKTEISSVKGLLLGRHSFPATPFSATTASQSIPAWQKASSKKTENQTKNTKEEKIEDAKTSSVVPDQQGEDNDMTMSKGTEEIINEAFEPIDFNASTDKMDEPADNSIIPPSSSDVC